MTDKAPTLEEAARAAQSALDSIDEHRQPHQPSLAQGNRALALLDAALATEQERREAVRTVLDGEPKTYSIRVTGPPATHFVTFLRSEYDPFKTALARCRELDL